MDALPSFSLNDVEKKANESLSSSVKVVYNPARDYSYGIYVNGKLGRLYRSKFFAIRNAKKIAKNIKRHNEVVWSS